MNDAALAVDTQDQRIACERAEHECDAPAGIEVCSGFVAAAGEVEPDNARIVQHAAACPCLRRDVDVAVAVGGATKKRFCWRMKVVSLSLSSV